MAILNALLTKDGPEQLPNININNPYISNIRNIQYHGFMMLYSPVFKRHNFSFAIMLPQM